MKPLVRRLWRHFGAVQASELYGVLFWRTAWRGVYMMPISVWAAEPVRGVLVGHGRPVLWTEQTNVSSAADVRPSYAHPRRCGEDFMPGNLPFPG